MNNVFGSLAPHALDQVRKNDSLKQAAWHNAASYLGSDVIRLDCDSRIIKWSEYGLHSEYGWEIDHIVPISLGGADASYNVRARHWRGNSLAGGLLSLALAEIGRSGR